MLFQWTVVGVTGETGDNAALHVGVEPKNAHETVQIPLRQVVGHSVQETAKKHGLAIMELAMVGDLWQFSVNSAKSCHYQEPIGSCHYLLSSYSRTLVFILDIPVMSS